MKVALHPAADEELSAAIQYYEDRQAGLGERLYKEVIEKLDWVSSNPELPRRRKNHRRVNLGIFPFFIAYAIEDDLILVVAVAHGHRRPGYWNSRMRQT